MVSARSARQRELGQNFLADRNILGVIERLAALGREDVVLEVGGGQGVLSERLAPAVAHLHVVELDRRLEDQLGAALARFDNVTLHIADAVALDLVDLDPAPTKIVANLPYGVAATVILRTVADLPTVTDWVVMVQREVGERFAAAPGSGAYGVPSVLAQLACEVKILRPVSRNVFRPIPNVDSVLLGLRRVGPGADPAFVAGSSTAPLRTAARRWPDRWPWPALRLPPAAMYASAPAPLWSSSATPPTSAPNGCRRRSSGSWGAGCERGARDRAGQDQPMPVPRPGPRRWASRAGHPVAVGLPRRRADRL